jgi:hypothetical protein
MSVVPEQEQIKQHKRMHLLDLHSLQTTAHLRILRAHTRRQRSPLPRFTPPDITTCKLFALLHPSTLSSGTRHLNQPFP